MISRRSMAIGAATLMIQARGARAQGGRRAPLVGFVGLASEEADRESLAALRGGLMDQPATVALIARHATGDHALATDQVRELARMPVGVFVAPGPAIARLIHRVTEVPVVAILLSSADSDLYQTVAKPGGRVTGFTAFGEELSAKRVEIVRELMPALTVLGVLHNATDPTFANWGADTARSAERAGLRAIQLPLRSGDAAEVTGHMAALRAAGGDVVVVIRDFLTTTAMEPILQAAEASGVAVMSELDRFTAAGALMSYGPDTIDLFRRAAGVAHRIVMGASPAELPIETPTKYRFILNMRTARRMGLAVPHLLLARADEVIE